MPRHKPGPRPGEAACPKCGNSIGTGENAWMDHSMACSRRKPPPPFRVEQLKIVIKVGDGRWQYALRKDGGVDVGQVGRYVDEPAAGKGQVALTVVTEEIRKAIGNAVKRLREGDAPKADNGMNMIKAAGIELADGINTGRCIHGNVHVDGKDCEKCADLKGPRREPML